MVERDRAVEKEHVFVMAILLAMHAKSAWMELMVLLATQVSDYFIIFLVNGLLGDC